MFQNNFKMWSLSVSVTFIWNFLPYFSRQLSWSSCIIAISWRKTRKRYWAIQRQRHKSHTPCVIEIVIVTNGNFPFNPSSTSGRQPLNMHIKIYILSSRTSVSVQAQRTDGRIHREMHHLLAALEYNKTLKANWNLTTNWLGENCSKL